MNKKISIKNFRVFKDYSDFELKPITILTGTNSSGKSSFIKALKLLQNNIDTNNVNPSNFDKLEFNNQDIYSLGGFSKIISKYNNEKEVYFKLNYYNEFFGELYSEIVFEQDNNSQKDEGIIKRHTVYTNDKKIIEIEYDEKECRLKKSYLNKDIWVDTFFELLKKAKNFRSIIKICEKLSFALQLDEKEKIIKEELLQKGVVYEEDPLSGNGDFYQNEHKYIGKKSYDLTTKLKTQKVFFLFDFYYKIARFRIRDFKNINYNLINDKDKEDVYFITTEFLDNGISSIDELENIINEMTKNYITKHLLKESVQIPDPYDSKDRKLNEIHETIDINLLDLDGSRRANLEYFKTDNEFIQQKLLKENLNNATINDIIKILKDIIDDVLTDAYRTFYEIKDFPFIGDDRADLQRIFLYNNKSKFMQIMNKFLSFNKNEIKQKFTFINKWIKEFNIADELIIDYDTDGVGIKIHLINNKERILLSDVGYGINMLIPLIVSLASYEKSYVFIEEPEANLHPSLQSKLASLFVDAFNQFGTMSVIETHSEYLIRKFQILIADKQINIKAKDVNIYYLYHPETKPEESEQIYLMKIREDGIMENSFGQGFFDEAGNLGLELLNLINLN